MHFTLKTNPMKRENLDEFVRLYTPQTVTTASRHGVAPTIKPAQY